jgi:hypothetical protein
MCGAPPSYVILLTGWLNKCKQVLSAYEFEQHAGAKTRHPNNHIYLENGKPIYSIIQELKTAPLSMIDGVIKDVAGSSINEEFFRVWKGDICFICYSFYCPFETFWFDLVPKWIHAMKKISDFWCDASL